MLMRIISTYIKSTNVRNIIFFYDSPYLTFKNYRIKSTLYVFANGVA